MEFLYSKLLKIQSQIIMSNSFINIVHKWIYLILIRYKKEVTYFPIDQSYMVLTIFFHNHFTIKNLIYILLFTC